MGGQLPFERERRAMVEYQLRRRGIREPKVLEAMFQVPRHEFVPPALVDQAYEDRPLPIGESETISQPYMVAAMTQAAQLKPGEKVLEVGTGSGYQAAILAWLGGRVYTIERNPGLAEEARERLRRLCYKEVQVLSGDGSEGYPPAAPYDVIAVTAAAPKVPQVMVDQLAEGGRLLIPVGDLRLQELQLVFKHGGQLARRGLDLCQFVPLVGKYGWPEERAR